MSRDYRHGDGGRSMHILDADLVKLAAAIQQTSACSIWEKRLTDLRVTKIERRLRTAWFCRQTYWHAELESSDGWKATIHSTRVKDAIDLDEFVREVCANGVDLDEFEPGLFLRALRCALGQPFRVAQDRLDTAACDASCIEERGGAR